MHRLWSFFHKHASQVYLYSLSSPRIGSCKASTSASSDMNEKMFQPRRALLLSKTTRYEFEARRHYDDDDDNGLRRHLQSKGSDLDGLLARHRQHHSKLKELVHALKNRGIDFHLVDRSQYLAEAAKPNGALDWADVILSAGGDGTFLLAASRIHTSEKPIIGFNTDPLRSEGHLCLHKRYSNDFGGALDLLLANKFRWLMRSRIRVTMSGKHACETTSEELRDLQFHAHEQRYVEHVRENEEESTPSKAAHMYTLTPQRLPVLALNECFIGESLSARVSYYELAIDGQLPVKQKSSGVMLCTGTGSTSWNFNINHLCTGQIETIIRLSRKQCIADSKLHQQSNACCMINMGSLRTLEKIAREYNSALRFEPQPFKMAFTVRDPIINGIFQVERRSGFAQHLRIRSRMWDALIVIDGGSSFVFNDGAIAEFECKHPEDSLRCVHLLSTSLDSAM